MVEKFWPGRDAFFARDTTSPVFLTRPAGGRRLGDEDVDD
jgi:hypothetical protein